VQHIVGRLENVEYREGGGLGSFLKKLFGRAPDPVEKV
jgi:flagellar biosynthesis protein FlhG